MLILPDLNRLRVFYHIFAEQSLVAASKTLNITPSAVSQHLKKLESEIGTALFIRQHKRLVPTPEAEKLLAIIKPFFHDLEVGLRAINQSRETPAGRLRVGAPLVFGKTYFPGMFASFRIMYPQVTFVLKLGDPAVLLGMLGDGLLDFALVDIFLSQRQFSADLRMYRMEPVVDEELILACSRNYYEHVLGGDCSFASLVSREFISYYSNDLALKSWFGDHFGKSSARLNIVMTVDNVDAVLSGIEHGLGMGIIPSHLVHDAMQKGSIVPVTTTSTEIINRISLVQLKGKQPSLTEKTFLSFYKKMMQQDAVVEKFSRIVDNEKV
ncbi:MAG: LysR family transcriptional regulator [Desulfoplanes sp.]|nr:LysR family transcriptional regulator [Desulfoplanes sp.]